MPDIRTPEARPPLTTPVFHILLALAGQERHGYGIILDIAARTDGQVRVGTGTLYTALKRLLDEGLVAGARSRRPAPPLLPAHARGPHGARRGGPPPRVARDDGA